MLGDGATEAAGRRDGGGGGGGGGQREKGPGGVSEARQGHSETGIWFVGLNGL